MILAKSWHTNVIKINVIKIKIKIKRSVLDVKAEFFLLKNILLRSNETCKYIDNDFII